MITSEVASRWRIDLNRSNEVLRSRSILTGHIRHTTLQMDRKLTILKPFEGVDRVKSVRLDCIRL